MSVSHWHVQRHSEDDDVYATKELADALTYAAQELGRIAESEQEGITEHGNTAEKWLSAERYKDAAYGFREAYRCYGRWQQYANLSDNADNLWKQATVPAEQRAPLYRDEPAQGPRWQEAAKHAVDRINEDGPSDFGIWSCLKAECEPSDDD